MINAFIDTSIFYNARFNFGSGVLETLVSLVKAKHIQLYLTEVTVSEIKKGISKETRKVREVHSEFLKKSLVRFDSDKRFSVVFKKFSEDELSVVVTQGFELFLKETKPKVLALEPSTLIPVFNKYFSSVPPFGVDGKEKEFPDAFAIALLEKYFGASKDSVYVVSADNGFRKSCDSKKLVPLEHLHELLDKGFQEVSSGRTKLLKAATKRQEGTLKQEIRKAAKDLSFTLVDQNDEEFEVKDVTVKLEDVSIVKLDSGVGKEFEATISIECELLFKVFFEYPDFDTATWDSEDRQYFFHHTVERIIDYETTTAVEIDVLIEKAKIADVLHIRFPELEEPISMYSYEPEY